MNEQEIFTKVATHLLTQGKQAFEDGVCRYRTSTGLKCAVGCLIPDERYRPEMESLNVYGLLSHGLLTDDWVINCMDLLKRLQTIHDVVDPDRWREALIAAAEYHNLIMPIV